MAATTLDGKLANKGLLGPKVAIGDRLDEIHDFLAALLSANRTVCFSTAGLAEGTNAATFQIGTAITYSINGVRYTKGVTDNIAFTAAAIQATDTNCIYLICIDAAGTLSTVKGRRSRRRARPRSPRPPPGPARSASSTSRPRARRPSPPAPRTSAPRTSSTRS